MLLIWVTGANGQVGHAFKKVIQETRPPWEVRYFSHADFDITVNVNMSRWFKQEVPSCIINLAAYTEVDRAESEPDKAYAINSMGVKALAELCAMYAVPLIHVSTDYVFSGHANQPYREDAIKGPESVYGLSKASGEVNIAESHAQSIIVRTSWIFSEYGANFVTKILQRGFMQRHVHVISDQIGCPTAADNLAMVICHIVSKVLEGKGTYGIYHYRDQDIFSWFTFAQRIFSMAVTKDSRWGDIRIAPVPASAYHTPAKRPAYSVLNVDKLTRDYGMIPMRCDEALERVVEKTLEQLTYVSA